MIYRGFKYRLYPTFTQSGLIDEILDNTRFVYNAILESRISYFNKHLDLPFNHDLNLLDSLLNNPKNIKLLNTDKAIYLQTVKTLQANVKRSLNEFKRLPRFKSKNDTNQSYKSLPPKQITITNNRIDLNNLGKVKIKFNRPIEGKVLNMIISKTNTGKYFISFLCVLEDRNLGNNGKEIGIDVGIKDFYTDSNNNHIENPRYLEKQTKKLKTSQKKLTRMLNNNIDHYYIVNNIRIPVYKRPISECKNINKQKKKIAKIYEHIKNQRTHFLAHKANELVKENKLIVVENLNIKGLLHAHRLSRSISSISWGIFFKMLEYKTKDHNASLIKVPTFFPSSLICHTCGYKNKLVKDLSIRNWLCPNCKTINDRDHNAALNILKKGQIMLMT